MHTRRTCPPCGGRRAASRWMRTARRSSSRARRTSHYLARRSRQAPTWRRWRGRWPSNGARHDRSTGHACRRAHRAARAPTRTRRGRRGVASCLGAGCVASGRFESLFSHNYHSINKVGDPYRFVKEKTVIGMHGKVYTAGPARARAPVAACVPRVGSATTGQPQPAATVEERSYWGGEAALR